MDSLQHKNSGLPNNCVYSITFDQKGKLYIGTMGGGLAIFDGKSKWKIYNEKNSEIPQDWIYSIAIDKNLISGSVTFSDGLGVLMVRNGLLMIKQIQFLKTTKLPLLI